MRDLWDIAPCSLVVDQRFRGACCLHYPGDVEAVLTSETSVYSNETIRRSIPEGSYFYTRRRENLKSHICVAEFY
jgi:hypothetical protein